MVIRHARAQRPAGDLGIVPLDGECDRRIAEHAEIVAVVRVLPDVFAADHEIFRECLFKAGMKFISIAGRKSGGDARDQRRDHGVIVIPCSKAPGSR